MRRQFYISVTLTVIALLPMSLVHARPQNGDAAGPSLTLDKREVQLGTMYSGEVKKFSFRISNTGTKNLAIISVQPSCGCTAVRTPKKELKPGESDRLELEFNSTGIQGDVAKAVTIQTNDPKNISTVVTFHANVISEFRYLRKGGVSTSIVLGSFFVGRSFRDTVALINISGKPITVVRVGGSSQTMTAKIERKFIAVSDTVKVFLNIVPNQSGLIREKLWLETNNMERPRIPVLVSYFATSK